VPFSSDEQFDNEARTIALIVLNWRKCGMPETFDSTLIPELRQRLAKIVARHAHIDKQPAD
jgi:hypothetical protein